MTPEQVEHLAQVGIDYKVVVDDLVEYLAEVDMLESPPQSIQADNSWYASYHPSEDFAARLDTLAALPLTGSVSRAGLVKRSIGKTLQGRDIWNLAIGTNLLLKTS